VLLSCCFVCVNLPSPCRYAHYDGAAVSALSPEQRNALIFVLIVYLRCTRALCLRHAVNCEAG